MAINDTVEQEENKLEEKEPKNDSLVPAPETSVTTFNEDYTSEKKKHSVAFKVLISCFVLLVVAFIGLNIYHYTNTNIIAGVSIKGIDVSNKSMSDARYSLDNYIKENLPAEIKIKYQDFESTISLDQLEAQFLIKDACQEAYNIGRNGNFFENNLTILTTLFGKTNIEPELSINEEFLTKQLSDLTSQLPEAVTQSSYYIEGSDLIVTSGNTGNAIDIPKTINNIKKSIIDFSCKDKNVALVVNEQEPNPIDIDKIYEEVRKDPVDASYTTDPFTVHPSENGYDFNISIDAAKKIVSSEEKSEYTIPLKILLPNVTTNMIGTEAFPDQLSNFSTNYSTRDTNRTTNLRLAADKINGTVLMPGETFSYNKVVGERTIAAGYREAPIYVQGQVVDGLGGGICQIATTLYNAVLYANLEIVERSNHQFVPSYVKASRDATVVYGSLDFQFKNNREYPIKLVCSVSGGVANFQIFGLKSDNEYEVEMSNYETKRTSTAIYSEAYRILKQNGQVVSSELLSRDTYKRH